MEEQQQQPTDEQPTEQTEQPDEQPTEQQPDEQPRVWSAVPDGEQPGIIIAGRLDRLVSSSSRTADGKVQHRLVAYGDLVMLDSSRKPIPVRTKGEQPEGFVPPIWREQVSIPAGVMHRLAEQQSIPLDEQGRPAAGSPEWQSTVRAMRATALRHGLRAEYRLPASVEAGSRSTKVQSTEQDRAAALADLLAAAD